MLFSMKIRQFGIVLAITLITASLAMPTPMHKGKGMRESDSSSQGDSYTNVLKEIERQVRIAKSETTRNEWLEQQRKFLSVGGGGKGNLGNNEHLKLYVINKKEGKAEAYDAKKHLNFPTDLRPGKMEQALKEALDGESSKHLTKEEKHVIEHNIRSIYTAANYLARDGGSLHDDKNGYWYGHDDPKAFGPYAAGGPSSIFKDNNGKIQIHPMSTQP